jgi:hypothetical protein
MTVTFGQHQNARRQRFGGKAEGAIGAALGFGRDIGIDNDCKLVGDTARGFDEFGLVLGGEGNRAADAVVDRDKQDTLGVALQPCLKAWAWRSVRPGCSRS